jgi:ribonuclease VapC
MRVSVTDAKGQLTELVRRAEIAVDTSALIAIVLDELQAGASIAALEAEDEILISGGTLAETLIVSARRDVGEEMARFVDRLALTL